MLERLSRFLRSEQRHEPAQARSSLALPAADIELIVPMIKGVTGSESENKRNEIQLSYEQSPASLPFAADMVVMYAIDRPTHLEYVSNEVATATGLTTEQLHDIAVRNLPSRLSNVQLHDCGEGIYGLSAGGTFEASLLLLNGIWQDLAQYLPGVPLATVPSRDLLFVIGSARPNAERLIASRARIHLPEKRYAISRSVLARRNGKWVAQTH